MKDAFYLSLVQLFYDILTKTQKYIKPPPKLHDPDHAPNVADIVTRYFCKKKLKKMFKSRMYPLGNAGEMLLSNCRPAVELAVVISWVTTYSI